MSSQHRLVRDWSTCAACGKRTYLSRAAAKSAAREHPEPGHLSAYKCVRGGWGWHLGNLPASVIRGVLSRADLY